MLVGRGGQIALVYTAYQVFVMSLQYLMESRPVSFETYAAVAFDVGSTSSIWHFICACFSQRFRASWRALRLYVAFVLATLYVVAMPTLFSAMTGYAVVSKPSIEVPPSDGLMAGMSVAACESWGGCQIFSCGGSLRAGWGQLVDSDRVAPGRIDPYYIADGSDDAVISCAYSISVCVYLS